MCTPTSTVLNLEINWSILVNTSSLANSHCLTCCPSLKNFWIFLLTSSKVSLKKEQISIAFRVFSYASSASDLKISAGSRYVRAYKQIKKAKKNKISKSQGVLYNINFYLVDYKNSQVLKNLLYSCDQYSTITCKCDVHCKPTISISMLQSSCKRTIILGARQ